MSQRWQDSLSPFDGDCLITDDLFSVEELRELLSIVVPMLERYYGGQSLYTFEDWHQHDGYVTDRGVIDWGDLAAVSRSAKALIESRSGDTYVHRSFYPEDFAFLLRYDVPDADGGDGSSFTGTFDLSVSPSMISKLTAIVPAGLRPRLRIEPSKGYFDRTYAG